MFQMPARKAMATARPASSNGQVRTATSDHPSGDPKAPSANARSASSGLAPASANTSALIASAEVSASNAWRGALWRARRVRQAPSNRRPIRI
jgi:hypothetical protein